MRSGEKDVVPAKRDWKIRLLAYTPKHADSITCLTTSPTKKHHAKHLPCTVTSTPTGTLLTFSAVPTSHAIIVELHAAPELDIIDPLPRLYEIIDRGQSDLEQKRDVWNTVNNGDSVLNKVRNLQGKGLKGEFLDALLEVLVADERAEAGERMEF